MKKETDSLSSWCKWLEVNFSPEIMIPTLPVIIRLDGVNFHNWTKGLDYPFDEKYYEVMNELTKFLIKETGAIVGYTQSDEITLILYSDSRDSKIYHNGKKQKILSKLPSYAANFFNELVKVKIPNKKSLAIFDCRIYQTPTLKDAVAQLLWRENDAIRNSILMSANSLFGHKKCLNLNTSQLIKKMVDEADVYWENYPSRFKRGAFFKRIKIFKKFESTENLPKNHNALKNPDTYFLRTVIEEAHYPQLNSILNKVDVIFYDEVPIIV